MTQKIGEKQFKTIKEQVNYMIEHGEAEAAKKFDVRVESLHRKKRLLFEYLGKSTTDNIAKIPRVLVFDVETSLMQVLAFSLFKPVIPHECIQTKSHLLSWAGKWLNEPDIFGGVLTLEEAKDHNDERIVKDLWQKFEEADVIIAHNSKRFDRKVANARFVLNGLKPPSPYNMIDTLEIAKKEFKFSSNRLDHLGKIIVNDEKLHTNIQLWIDCFNGDGDALDEMYTYNKQDVVLLEEVYHELKPWMNSHPNMAVFAETHEPVCTVCLSDDITETKSYYVTPAGRFTSVRCNKCGAISRRRISELGKAQKENLLINTAR
jgi:DNA polymerase elongation subunit (family B)